MPAASTSATTAAATGTPGILDARLADVMGLLNGSDLDEDVYADLFATVFRDQVPFDAFTPTLEQLQRQGPWSLGEEQSRSPTTTTVVARSPDGTEGLISLSVDAAGQVDGLQLQPGDPPELDPPVGSIDDAIARLGDVGALRMAASTVDGASCTTDAGVASSEAGPIGSVSKLYVLGAVVDAIDAGSLDWTDELVISDRVRSLPSGILQDREDGATVTVAAAVDLMVSISDNTATDLLVDTVGRQAVEDAQAAWGHDTPQRNIPFMTTGELFRLKAADDAIQERWITGDEGTRRDVLDGLAGVDLPSVTLFAEGPIRPDELEWFASPEDMCRVLGGLAARFDDPAMAPLSAALTANPGVPPDDPDRWSSIAFKGGSEPGLLAVAFLVEDGNGQVHALTGSVVDPAVAFDEAEPVLLFAAVRDLLPAAPEG